MPGSNPAEVDRISGRTALHFAAASGHEHIVAQLLGPELNVDGIPFASDGMTPLHFAAQYGHDTIVKRLLAEWPAQAIQRNNYGHTPLHLAAGFGYESIVEQLLAVMHRHEIDAGDTVRRDCLDDGL